MAARLRSRLDRRLVGLLVVLLLLGAALSLAPSARPTKTVTAHFPRAVSVYDGTDVRILGVNVGEVTAVIPEGESVRVEMEYDAAYDLPEDAQAVIVTPTLVADRFVQLTPVHTEGPTMPDGADIPLAETGVPVELDRIYASLQDLTVALGPNGVNAEGTLDNLLRAAQRGLEGQGARGNRMIRDLADAAEVFGEGSGPLFRTVEQLAVFTETLAQNDRLVRAFVRDLAGVSSDLADERDELEQAVAAVADAVGTVRGFVRDNRGALVRDVEKLTRVVGTIEDGRESIDTALEVAPVAIGNLAIAFNNQTGTVGSRIGVQGNVWDADGFLCALVQQAPPVQLPQSLKDVACTLFSQILEPVLDQVPEVPPPYAPEQSASEDGAGGRTSPQSGDQDADGVRYAEDEGPSLGGLLGGGAS